MMDKNYSVVIFSGTRMTPRFDTLSGLTEEEAERIVETKQWMGMTFTHAIITEPMEKVDLNKLPFGTRLVDQGTGKIYEKTGERTWGLVIIPEDVRL